MEYVPESIVLGSDYKVSDLGSSCGSQSKFRKGNYWYKLDKFGHEGLCEWLVSSVLKFSNFDNYVEYTPCTINGVGGCKSRHFLKESEILYSFEQLYKKSKGVSLSRLLSNMDNVEERVEVVLSHFKGILDVEKYLQEIFSLDYLILNEDRHLNNLAVVVGESRYKPAPIFDNGYSLLSCSVSFNKNYSMEENVKRVTSKPFSGSPRKQLNLFGNCLKLDYIGLLRFLTSVECGREVSVLKYMLKTNVSMYVDLKVKSLVYNGKQVGIRIKSGRNYYDAYGQYRVRNNSYITVCKAGNQLISGINDNVEEIILNSEEVNLLKQYKCIV